MSDHLRNSTLNCSFCSGYLFNSLYQATCGDRICGSCYSTHQSFCTITSIYGVCVTAMVATQSDSKQKPELRMETSNCHQSSKLVGHNKLSHLALLKEVIRSIQISACLVPSRSPLACACAISFRHVRLITSFVYSRNQETRYIT